MILMSLLKIFTFTQTDRTSADEIGCYVTFKDHDKKNTRILGRVTDITQRMGTTRGRLSVTYSARLSGLLCTVETEDGRVIKNLSPADDLVPITIAEQRRLNTWQQKSEMGQFKLVELEKIIKDGRLEKEDSILLLERLDSVSHLIQDKDLEMTGDYSEAGDLPATPITNAGLLDYDLLTPTPRRPLVPGDLSEAGDLPATPSDGDLLEAGDLPATPTDGDLPDAVDLPAIPIIDGDLSEAGDLPATPIIDGDLSEAGDLSDA